MKSALALKKEGYILIEASAGTGKTFAITELFVKLVAVDGFKASNILTLTFTKAAASELVERTRKKLTAALENPNTLSKELQEAVLSEKARRRIERALADFSQAPIFTIHGFCQRLLKDYSFECKVPFGLEVETAEEELFSREAREVFRRHFLTRPLESLRELSESIEVSKVPETLGLWAKILSSPPFPEVGTEAAQEKIDFSEIKRHKKRLASKVLEVLKEHNAHFVDSRLDSESLKEALQLQVESRVGGLFPVLREPTDFKSKKQFVSKVRKLCLYLSGPSYPLFLESLSKTVGKAKKLTRVSRLPLVLDEEGFEEDLAAAVEGFSKDLEPLFKKAAFLAKEQYGLLRPFVEETLERTRRTKLQDRLLSYTDMLVYVRKAVEDESFCREVRQRFPVALVDEFQDTDRLQWEILKRIYPDSKKSSLFLVGDPKQAIYGFRGGDIFTYLEARKHVPEDRRLELQNNWRSDAGLVEFFNRLFSYEGAFALEGLEYSEIFSKKERKGQPVKVFYVEESPRPEVPEANVDIEKCTDWNIEDFKLEPNLKGLVAAVLEALKERSPGELAVLTRTNLQALKVDEVLREKKVPTVLYSSQKIFETQEAKDALFIMKAILSPRGIPTALGTFAFCLDREEFERLLADESTREAFLAAREIWERAGLLASVWALFERFKVPQRLLEVEDGARRLSRLRQIFYVCSKDFELESTSPEQVVTALATALREPPAQEIPLELGTDAVKIMTYHRSKGLEFPVVFLPYLLEEKVKETELFFDGERYVHSALSLVPRDFKEAREYYRQILSEFVRLSYVAVTRAKEELVLVSTRSRASELFYRHPDIDRRMDSLEALEAVSDLSKKEAKSLEEARLEEPRHVEFLEPPKAEADWTLESFSSLTRHRERIVEETSLEIPLAEFPRGVSVGTALHEILEKIDFSSPKKEILERCFKAYGIPLEWLPVLWESLNSWLEIDIIDGARLKDLKDFSKEMYFRHSDQKVQMQGFIDLVFKHNGKYYFADYKSTWLGGREEDYLPSRLQVEMQVADYFLQARIYARALHKFLKECMEGYDRSQFGGGSYLFLRHLTPKTGVFKMPASFFEEDLDD